MKICQYLVGRGFFCALGTTEYPAGVEREVWYESPRRSDSNNGVAVVYDEVGAPWVRGKPITSEEWDWLMDHGIKFGNLYVPHSNGGDWLARMESKRDENNWLRMVREPAS